MPAKPLVSVRTQFDAYNRTVRRLSWLNVGAIFLLALMVWVPQLFSSVTVSPWLRGFVGLASALVVLASTLGARALRARIADAQLLGADWTQYARDLKARADHDPAARKEYVAYLRDSRELVQLVPDYLKRHWIVTDQHLAPSLAAIDAEIASYERALDPEGGGTEAR